MWKKNVLTIVVPVFITMNCCITTLYSQDTARVNAPSNTSQPAPKLKPFNGMIGIFAGGSRIGCEYFADWARRVSNGGKGMKTTSFINIGAEAFVVSNHFVLGVVYTHESLFTNGAEISPNRGSIALHLGGSPSNPYKENQVFFTVGVGYSKLTLKFHGNPPLYLQDPSIPNDEAKMIQNAFWLNPKVHLVRRVELKGGMKFKVGLDAGVSFYIPGNYKYGYTYTYYTYTYTNGSTRRTAQTKFYGYQVYGIPYLDKIGFNISAFVGL